MTATEAHKHIHTHNSLFIYAMLRWLLLTICAFWWLLFGWRPTLSLSSPLLLLALFVFFLRLDLWTDYKCSFITPTPITVAFHFSFRCPFDVCMLLLFPDERSVHCVWDTTHYTTHSLYTPVYGWHTRNLYCRVHSLCLLQPVPHTHRQYGLERILCATKCEMYRCKPIRIVAS